MPLIRMEVPAQLEEEQKKRIMSEASAAVSRNTGKPELYVMVTISKADFMLAGEAKPCAFVDVRGIGGVNSKNNRGITSDICSLLQKELSISPDCIYVTFTDVPGQNWGHNGTTFA